MSEQFSDRILVSSYVKDGEEAAFRSLVRRHIDLVFATAPRLAGYETLAGWLHKTTLLESRARIRSELRRKNREQTAAEIHAMTEGHSPMEALIPILDEALLSLRENDRTAVVSRFFERKSLRDVGAALGVDEDAARKRVSRALDRLSEFFRNRGFAVPAGTGLAALFNAGSQAAPPALAATVAQCGLTAGAASGLKLLVFNLMAMSKAKTAVVCVAMFTVPLFWQVKTEADLGANQANLLARIGEQQQVLSQLANDHDDLQQALLRAGNSRLRAESRAAKLRLRHQQGNAPRYEWDDARPVVRLPKEYLKYLEMSAFTNVAGRISQPMIELLQLNEPESAQLQHATDSFLAAFQAVQARAMNYERRAPTDRTKDPGTEERSFQFADVREEFKPLREEYFGTAQELLGSERFDLFRKGLTGWIPLDPESKDSRSSDSLVATAHLITCKPPDPEQGWALPWQMKFENGAMSLWRQPEEIPAFMVPYLQDWIALSLKKRSENPPASPLP